jgi:hypothetical protein
LYELISLDKLDPNDISFVHNALPDLALDEIDVTMRFGSPETTLKVPILVLAKTPEEALALSSANPDISLMTRNGSKIALYINGKPNDVDFGRMHEERVGDGIEAAKVIRMGGIPFISAEQLGELQLYIKQLRIAMFLTNSNDIEHLKKAPIYVTR